MPDGYTRVRRGEKRPIYGQTTMATGTLTIAASPAPIVTVYDGTGAAVAGMSALAVTGYDAGVQSAPRVWMNLDATGLATGFYTVVFTFTATAVDGLTRIYTPTIEVQVLDMLA